MTMKKNTAKPASIIDEILKKSSEDFDQTAAPKYDYVVDANSFFTENNPDGFMTKKGLLTMLEGKTRKELADFDAFLQKLSSGATIECNPNPDLDKSGRECIYVKIWLKNGSQPYKVYTSEMLSDFIGLYQDKAFTCDLSLTSLYKTAIA